MNFQELMIQKKQRAIFINKIVNRPPKFAQSIAKLTRKILNKPRLGILGSLDHMNREKLEKKEITIKEKQLLLASYKEDIKKTEKILNQDLSSWLA